MDCFKSAVKNRIYAADPEILIFYPFFLHLRTFITHNATQTTNSLVRDYCNNREPTEVRSKLQRSGTLTCSDSTGQDFFIFKLAAFKPNQHGIKPANSSSWGHLIAATKVCPDSFVSLYNTFGSISKSRLDNRTTESCVMPCRYSVCPCLLQWQPVCGTNPSCFDVVSWAAPVCAAL